MSQRSEESPRRSVARQPPPSNPHASPNLKFCEFCSPNVTPCHCSSLSCTFLLTLPYYRETCFLLSPGHTATLFDNLSRSRRPPLRASVPTCLNATNVPNAPLYFGSLFTRTKQPTRHSFWSLILGPWSLLSGAKSWLRRESLEARTRHATDCYRNVTQCYPGVAGTTPLLHPNSGADSS